MNQKIDADSVLGDDDDALFELRVSSRTPTKELAQALASQLRKNPKARIAMVCIGPGPTCQAVKAVPVLNTYMANKAKVYTVLPSMEDRSVEEDGRKVERTVTVLRLIPYRF